ncbi:MAG: 30S ribosomal protein S24e [Candidatus Methanoperedens sp.]|nr:30S ribosomal protein S24e [Candidatus Methanoperedens sp.]
MELQIIKDKTNPLLKRREISLKIINKGTPSRIEVKNKLAALANSKPELIVIEHLNTLFGKQEIVGTASIYESDERLKQIAHQHLVARDAPKAAEENAAEAPAAVAKPEAKHEAKAEAKTEKKEPEKK